MRFALAMAAIGLAAPAFAADDSGRASDRALAPLVGCKATADPRARAACYDAALDKLQAAVAARQVVIMDREQVTQDRRSGFGFIGSKPPKVAAAPKAPKTPAPTEELQEIDSTVTSASQYGYDQWTIHIATGAVWRTTEPGIAGQPKPGTEVHIKRGLMGSFMIKVGKYRAVRAMRVG